MFEIHEFRREDFVPSDPSLCEELRLRMPGRREEVFEEVLGESVECVGGG